MTRIQQALLWATAILAMAIAARFGAIERDLATTLLIVLPPLAWLSISRGDRASCGVAGG